MKRKLHLVISIVLIAAIALVAAGFASTPVKSIKLNSNKITLNIGQTYSLKATITPSDAADKKLIFSSGNKNIASVDKNGKITALKAGSTVITVTSSSNKKISVKCNVTVSQAKLEPYEISWYMPCGGPFKDIELVQAEASKFLQKKINATIKLNFMDAGSFSTRVRTMLMAGEYLDLLFTADWFSPQYRELVSMGLLTPLNDPKTNLFDKYAPKTKALLGENVLKGTRIKGLNYGIPCKKEMVRCRGYCFNKKMVDKYKFDISTVNTYKDVEPMLKVIKEKEPNMYAHGGSIPFDWNFLTDGDVPLATYPDNRDTKVVFEYETPEFKDMCETMHRWWKLGYIRKDIATNTEDDVANYRVFAADFTLKPGKDAEISNQYGNQWVQKEITGRIMTNVELGGSMQAISRTSKDPARTMMFVELLNTDKYLNNLINYGIENKHYVKVSDNIIKYAPDTDNGRNSGYNPACTWMFQNTYLNYLFENEDPQKFIKFEEFNKSGLAMSTLGFSFDNQPVKTEIATIKNVSAQFNGILTTGSVDPAVYIPQAIKKFEAAGIRKVQNEIQKKLDEFLAQNRK